MSKKWRNNVSKIQGRTPLLHTGEKHNRMTITLPMQEIHTQHFSFELLHTFVGADEANKNKIKTVSHTLANCNTCPCCLFSRSIARQTSTDHWQSLLLYSDIKMKIYHRNQQCSAGLDLNNPSQADGLRNYRTENPYMEQGISQRPSEHRGNQYDLI